MTNDKDPREEAFKAEVDYKRRFLEPEEPDAILHDIYLILKMDELWKGVIAEDKFAQRIVKLKAPPYDREWKGVSEWSEVDDARTAIWLAEKHGMKKVATSTVQEAVMIVANDNAFHPVQQYLDALEWDKKERLDVMLLDYLEAPATDKELFDYTSLITRIWMISAVARIYEPGCKADYVLILEGDQRIGKSTFLNVLAGPLWFSDTPFDIRDKDAYQHLTGKWIIELQELDSFNKAETTRLKAFFSSKVDNYRPPYGRRNKDFPRQCVFAGTTNQTEYLRDNTGNLRFMPVYVRKLISDDLARDRDQLWAEAVHRYKAGELWYPKWEDFQLMAKYQSLREITNPWEDKIEGFLASQDEKWDGVAVPVTIPRILRDVLSIGDAAENIAHKSSQVGRILRKFGWERRQFTKALDRKDYGRNYYEKARRYDNDDA